MKKKPQRAKILPDSAAEKRKLSRPILLNAIRDLMSDLKAHLEWSQPFRSMPFPYPPTTDPERHLAFNRILNPGSLSSEANQRLAAEGYPDLVQIIENHKEKQGAQQRWCSMVIEVLNNAHRYLARHESSVDFHLFESRLLWRLCGGSKIRAAADISRENCLADLECMQSLLDRVHQRSRGPKTETTEDKIRSVLLLIARKAHGDGQKEAPRKIDIPQAHCSRLENGTRGWTTKDRIKCLPYIESVPRDALAKAFSDLARKHFATT